MNWTKIEPAKPGAYWWRSDRVRNDYPRLAFFDFVSGSWWMQRVGMAGAVPLFEVSGEWCGPLVPAEEVEKAWREGFRDRTYAEEQYADRMFLKSIAKQVVGGKL